jgi:hypothetical protein
MNPFQLSLLLVLLPVALQIIIGSLALSKKIKLHFGLVSLFCTLLLFVMIYFGLGIVADDAEKQAVRCGMPNAAFFLLRIIHADSSINCNNYSVNSQKGEEIIIQ